MYLKDLRIKNFRNYSDLFYSFKPGLIFFIGENGKGKTNLLEAIGFFAFAKSFRNLKEADLVKWNEKFFHLSGLFLEKGNIKIEIGFEKEPMLRRKIKLNDDLIKKKSDLIGQVFTVIFSPSDLRIIEDGPTERRRFIDSFISMSDHFYFELLQDYNRALKQRNALLKQKNVNENQMKIWDEMLIKKGFEIKNIRASQIPSLKEKYEKAVRMISDHDDEMFFLYKPNFSSREDFENKLKERVVRDKKIGFTSVGIHRDEIFIGNNNRDILEFGSQGQKRSTVLALKFGACEYLKERTGISPIILIDDVIRELDVKRREFFIKLISSADQTFFTTTDLNGIEEFIMCFPDMQIFEVTNNQIKEVAALVA